MEAAITFAETGHLCLGTLHSNNANQSIERIMNFFPVERHAQIYLQLSLNLRAIISQRLIPSLDGRRVPALEIMLDTPRIKDLIKRSEIDTLKEAMEQGIDEGCQTFDHVLLQLYQAGKISIEQALINADSANNLRLKIKLAGLKGDDAVAALLDKSAQKRKNIPDSGADGPDLETKALIAPRAGHPSDRITALSFPARSRRLVLRHRSLSGYCPVASSRYETIYSNAAALNFRPYQTGMVLAGNPGTT